MRTTVEEVRQIMDETSIADASITAYIGTANKLVNALLLNTGLSEELLTEIEKHITAHFITVFRERMAKKEGAGGAYIEYQGEYKDGLHATPFGQTAMLLDVTGTLNIMFEKQATIMAVKS